MAEIKIYGDIVPFKWWNDGSEYDLKDLSEALAGLSMSPGEELVVGIHTFGGCTTTAFAIYTTLRRFQKENKITLTTRVEGWCASSGVILLLAGDKRIGNKFAEPFVHNAWTWMFGANKHEAQKVMEDLTKVDNQIASLYEERTSITKEKALELMDADTFISAEDCMTYGFYTELEDVYAAENSLIFNSLRTLRKTNNTNNSKMSKNATKKEGKNSLIQELKNLIGVFSGGTNNKIVFTAENGELDFYELADDATPAVGDKALYDGKPAGESNDGEYLIADTGETYKFTGEVLTEIVAAADPGADPGANAEALQNEIDTLKAENKQLKADLDAKTTENSALNTKVKTAEQIVEKFKALNLSDDGEDDEVDDDGEGAAAGAGAKPRDGKQTASNRVPVRNLFKDIK